MLLGSTEWAETHEAELKQKVLVYINSDGNSRGFLGAEGSHSLQHLVNQVRPDVTDPETNVPVAARLRAGMQVAGTAPGANEEARERGKIALDATKELPIGALGSGSDYSPFLQHLGLAALNIAMAAKARSAASITPRTTRMSFTAASATPVLSMRRAGQDRGTHRAPHGRRGCAVGALWRSRRDGRALCR